MPLHDVGYRPWNEHRTWRWWRWLVIALTGIQLVWRGTWLRRTFFISWMPVAFIGVGISFYEQSITQTEARRGFSVFLKQALNMPNIAATFDQDPSEARHLVWSALLLTFFRYPQAIVMVLMIGIIAPRLISYDIRSRGFLLYFSRPIVPVEYVFGKSMVIWFYLMLITTLPALCLYVLGLLLSPQLGVIWETWDLPFRILAASIVLIVPTAAVATALSSLTTESRYAAVGWFAIWIVGWVSYSIFTTLAVSTSSDAREIRGRGRLREIENQLPELFERWRFISPYHVLGRVQEWVFGLLAEDDKVLPYAVSVVVVTAVSFIIVYLRVNARLRA
jgi:hypothetical protein